LSDKKTFTKQHLGGVAFIFGLLHGFGFSSVLRDIGLPQEEIPLSLFAFNLGIELGQLLFIFIITTLLYLFKQQFLKYETVLKKFLAYGIGTLASFWFLERIMLF